MMKRQFRLYAFICVCFIFCISCSHTSAPLKNGRVGTAPSKAGTTNHKNQVTATSAPKETTVDLVDSGDVKQGEKLLKETIDTYNRGGISPDGYQLVPILCYRNFTLNKKTAKGVNPRVFGQQMKHLKEKNYKVIPLSMFMEFVNGKTQIPEKSVVITVNGLSHEFIEGAVPVLEKYGYTATLFVEKGFKGHKSETFWSNLRELDGKGFSVQSGAGKEFDRESIDPQVSLAQYFHTMEREISFSKQVIEREIGKPCEFYSFPSGKVNNLVINILLKYGFKGAFNRSGNSNPFFVEPYNINRVEIDGKLSGKAFDKKLKAFESLDLN